MLLRLPRSLFPATRRLSFSTACRETSAEERTRWQNCVWTPPPTPRFFVNAQNAADRAAIKSESGLSTEDCNNNIVHTETFSYRRLLDDAHRMANHLRSKFGEADLKERRVAFLSPPTYDYVTLLWGIWLAGGTAVPLCPSHPTAELKYVVEDSDPTFVIAHPQYEAQLKKAVPTGLFVPDFPLEQTQVSAEIPTISADRQALIIYTSGTTGPPKGVVTSHGNIDAQVAALHHAWGWTASDVVYNVLPLHHVHGLVTAVSAALMATATVEMPRHGFDAATTWARFAAGGLSVFTAVPTVYSRLINEFEKQPDDVQQEWSASLPQLRLMVSGSAALPAPIMNRWQEISGHKLLERYGMTELGMVLSNPLHGVRHPGHVGMPLPFVDLKVVSDKQGEPGELRFKGPNVFQEYWRKPDATKESFDDEGYFMSGDVGALNEETQSFTLMGRSSVDIIKSAGYKISALDIERVLLAHPDIAECAVVGVPDLDYGERVAAVIVLADGVETISLDTVRAHCKVELAAYKAPSVLKIIGAFKRNAMQKINKKELKKIFDE
eukprot:m.94354 g.94354  ORF g.94354 m.94354 type:complete len:552 (-) comp21852_c0_seq2:84-1739(-)